MQSVTSNRFFQQLAEQQQQKNSLLCIGLDPDPELMPVKTRTGLAIKKLGGRKRIFDFNKAIIDATCDLACCYKPQIAHYAAYRAEKQLEKTIDYIHSKDVPVLLDAKRGDVGSTARMYARELFDRYQADAVTVNPWLGQDSLQPFLDYQDKGVFVVCRSTNPGGADLQNQPLLTNTIKLLYEVLAHKAANEWNDNGNIGLVVGATVPDEMRQVREICPGMMFLVPGIGAQGGDIAAMMAAGQGGGLLISSSRAIIYAGDGDDFAEKARLAAKATRDAINLHRQS